MKKAEKKLFKAKILTIGKRGQIEVSKLKKEKQKTTYRNENIT